MQPTRRNLLATASAAAAVTALAPMRGAAAADGFDIDAALADFLADLGQSPSDSGGAITFVGRDPILRSRFRLGACMAIPAMAGAVSAAAIWRERTGEGQDLTVDLRESIYNIMPVVGLILQHKQQIGAIDEADPIPSTFSFRPTVNGLNLQAPLLLGNPLGFNIFRTRDDRYVSPTGIYPHHANGILNLLKCQPNQESIAAAIAGRDALELDDAFAAEGLVMGFHRTREEWAETPEARHLAARPLIEIVKIADGEPIPWTPNPTQPLSGVRAMLCTHVIAGSTAGRTLAEYGAEVLHIARNQSFEHEIIWQDVNVGMRSSFVNLRRPDENAAAQALARTADVFVESFRARSMESHGLGVEQIAAMNPGVVYCSVRAYSWDGPWWNRAGFDMEALAVSGFTMASGRDGRPRFPPTMVLNDYIAGYLGAAGILAALRRRATEGGSYHVRVSLTRAAMWYAGLGEFESDEVDPSSPDQRMIEPRTVRAMTPYGEVRRLAPQVQFSRTPGRWREPLVDVRGSSRPVWLDRA